MPYRFYQTIRSRLIGPALVVALVTVSACSQLKPQGTPKSAEVSSSSAAIAIIQGFPSEECSATPPSPVAIRRLSQGEYAASMTSLTGKQKDWPLATDPKTAGYDHIWQDILVSKNHAGDFLAHAIAAADAIIAGPLKAPLANCGDRDVCLAELRKTTLSRIFRRPATPEQLTTYSAIAAKGANAAEGMQAVVATALFSPHFLYRTEWGSGSNSGSSAGNGQVTLTSYEIADQIAYSLTGAPPDAALRAKADSDALLKPDERRAEANRLIADKGFFAHSFAERWLQLAEPLRSGQSTAMKRSGTEELRRFSQNLITSGGFTRDWLTSTTTEVDSVLAAAYQVQPSGAGDWRKVNDTRRTGVLTSAAFTMAHSSQAGSAPIRRGLAIAKNVLCKTLPPPPPGLMENRMIAEDSSKTTRQMTEQHIKDDQCASCHVHFDHLGFTLENYDADGHYRTSENGLPVNTTISYLRGNHQQATITSLTDFASALADEPSYYSCVQLHLDTYFSGRDHLSQSCLIPDDQQSSWQTKTFRSKVLDRVSSDRFITRGQ